MKTFNTLVGYLAAFSAAKEAHAKPFAHGQFHSRQTASTRIPDSQNFTAPAFIGTPFTANPLPVRPTFKPNARHAHMDGGNTRTDDWSGPLGKSPVVGGSTTISMFMFWEEATENSHVLSAVVCGANPAKYCLNALNPDTLEPIAEFSAPGRNSYSSYWQVVDGRVVIPTAEGYIMVVDTVVASDGSVSFKLVNEYNVAGSTTQGSVLVTVGFDNQGNLWFTSTAVPLLNLPGVPACTVGYVRADGVIHALTIDNAIIENGVAINDNTMYVLTGPAGTEDHSNATGNFYAFQASSSGVKTLYNETYEAGSGLKLGGIARGSGSTVSLIGQKYVGITDNADNQINFIAFRQAEFYDAKKKNARACSFPLFKPGASGNEGSLNTYFDGTTYSATIANSYNSSFSFGGEVDNEGPQNKLSQSGIMRIDISDDGACSLAWEIDAPATMTTLSTGNGLYYTYTQDVDLAIQGKWAWYIVAYDWRNGKEVWRANMGNGGIYNTGVSHIQLGPKGRIYEGIDGGVSWMVDS